MTNEEAIRVLHCPDTVGGLYSKKYGEALNMAMEALKREPCEDAISRQAVDILVDELARAISDERCCISRGRSFATIMQDILDLPSVTPQPKTRWIPVSERLPEDNKAYLVTVELTFARGERYVSQERKVNWDKMKECSHEIIAWMPLPTPYKAESEEMSNMTCKEMNECAKAFYDGFIEGMEGEE